MSLEVSLYILLHIDTILEEYKMGFFSDILDGYNEKNKVRSLYRKDDYRGILDM